MVSKLILTKCALIPQVYHRLQEIEADKAPARWVCSHTQSCCDHTEHLKCCYNVERPRSCQGSDLLQRCRRLAPSMACGWHHRACLLCTHTHTHTHTHIYAHAHRTFSGGWRM